MTEGVMKRRGGMAIGDRVGVLEEIQAKGLVLVSVRTQG